MDRFKEIGLQIEKYCNENSRKLSSVKLIGVSKKQTVDKMQSLYNAGLRNFAENYVQEFLSKYEYFKDYNDICWHFIGGLQTNKVKYLVGKLSYIHSVDRLSLAKEISKQAGKKNISQKILLQIKFDNEGQRSGIFLDDLEALIKACIALPNLRIEGLMTVPPAGAEEVLIEDCFMQTKKALQSYKDMFSVDKGSFSLLSMGMSADFGLAIKHGAHFIRIGSALFGSRSRG